ncbi:hypothetical protein SAMN05443572_10695 [Myxococcus fulvus]|uniref:Uncharacterized protein n=1 Tax=Myxococcus fulvus TaxID=33 RepID=A0A511T2T6_MYXFU|nr:hypothetical protein [Myxococcus fulvus]GEN08476.1 hypothetical protein MFU01_35130 [Myxococcus fulvus]SEU20095.1 hypothetical protein SAMN05443572_10695 [Myxococcus fulvus]
MTSLNPLHRVVVAVVLAVAALWACGDEPRVASRIEAAASTDQPACPFVDNTPPDVARQLEGAVLTPIGDARNRVEDGKRVSTLSVRVEFPAASHSASNVPPVVIPGGEGTIICTGTCTGPNGCPPPKGCVAVPTGCSPLNCDFCDGGCSKTTIYIPPDGGTSDAGTPDAGTPNLR